MTKEEKKQPLLLPQNSRAFKQSNLASMHDNPKHREKPLIVQGQPFFPPNGRQWSSHLDNMEKLCKADRLIPTGKNIAYLMYIDDYPVIPTNNIWTDTLMRT